MTMTITERIKNELLNADINYYDALDAFKAEYPHGVSFLGETVSTKAATAYARYQAAEKAVNALRYLVESKLKGEELETKCREIIDRYNNAETSKAMEAAEKEYYSLYSLRTE
jgi:predicted ATP-grasp superfamily ATP-dependent carboligase